MRAYIEALYEATSSSDVNEAVQVHSMKKYMNFIGLGVEPTGKFLHEIRRVKTRTDFFHVCGQYLDHDEPMPLEPFQLELQPTDVLAGEHL